MTASAPTPDDDLLRLRPRLLGLAYRMLGEVDGAEDLVQEAFLRWQQQDHAAVASAEAWLVTVVSRLAIDRLRRASVERSRYVGPWLPEPVVTTAVSPWPAPDRRAELASDLSVALLLLLDSLSPEERAAFLLREVFGTPYEVIAGILNRRPDAVRQVVHRARTRVHEGRPRSARPADTDGALLGRFLSALQADDEAALLALLAPDVTLTSDGGGRALAARRPIAGADRVGRFLRGVTRKLADRTTKRRTTLNGSPAWLTYEGERLVTATVLDVDGEVVRAVYIVRNPDKLARLAARDVVLH